MLTPKIPKNYRNRMNQEEVNFLMEYPEDVIVLYWFLYYQRNKDFFFQGKAAKASKVFAIFKRTMEEIKNTEHEVGI